MSAQLAGRCGGFEVPRRLGVGEWVAADVQAEGGRPGRLSANLVSAGRNVNLESP